MEQENNRITCTEVTDDVILEYVEGTLGDDLREKVYQHFGDCPSCRVRAEEIRQIAGALRESPQLSEDIPVPASVDRAVFAAIKKASRASKPGFSKTLRWLAPLAAGVLALAVIVGLLSATGGLSEKPASGVATQREFDREPDLPLTAPVPVLPPAESAKSFRAAYEAEREKNRILEQAAAENEEHMGELNAKIAGLEKELTTELEKTAALSKKLEKSEDGARKLSESFKKLDEDYRALEKRSEATILTLKNKVEEMNRYIAGLEKQVGDLVARIDELGMKFRDAKTSAAQTKAHLLQLERDKARLEKRVLVTGDVNGDRKVDVLDVATIVNRLLAGYGVAYSREADANGDGRVDVGDALQILNKALVE